MAISGNRYFIQQYSHDEYVHGGVGYADAEEILLRKGYKKIVFPHYNDFSFRAKFSRFFYLFTILFSVKSGSDVVFIFPVFAKLNKLLIRLLKFKESIRLICFIADIDGIKDGNSALLKKEIRSFKKYDLFILHNQAMRSWLHGHIPEANCTAIEFFDFLANPFDGTRTKSFEIVFAGNLVKSSFLEKLFVLKNNSPELHFNLYGPGVSEAMTAQSNVSYLGIYQPRQLVAVLQGSFGLVWDGTEIDIPGGSLWDYMQYISHHKLSLYILSGLPLIVSETAASAPLVRKYGIGFTIKTFYEITEKISAITDEEYRRMRSNMIPLAEKISSGNCLKNALDGLMKNSGID